MKFGVGTDGNALSEKPEEIEQNIDWVKPGGDEWDQEAGLLDPDYQQFTVLHYAAMWGEISAIP